MTESGAYNSNEIVMPAKLHLFAAILKPHRKSFHSSLSQHPSTGLLRFATGWFWTTLICTRMGATRTQCGSRPRFS